MTRSRRGSRGAEKALAHLIRVSQDARGAARGHWALDPAIRGFGVGEKVSRGRGTGTPAVKVYVSVKNPREVLRAPVPSMLSYPGSKSRVRTDVVDLSALRSSVSSGARVRPAAAGCNISDPSGASGTLGGTFTRATANPGSRFILSCYHVLNAGGGGPGTPVLQPAGGDLQTDQIGHFLEGDPPSSSEINLIDAAVALVDPLLVSDAIPGIGNPRFSTIINEGMHVRIAGAVTELGSPGGVVLNASHHFPTTITDPNGKRRPVAYNDAVLCTPYSSEGDSGALVFNDAGEIVGLHFFGAADCSVFCKIEHVIDRFALRATPAP